MNSPLSLEKDKLYYMASFYFAFVANGVLLVLFKHHIVSSSVGCKLITFIYNQPFVITCACGSIYFSLATKEVSND